MTDSDTSVSLRLHRDDLRLLNHRRRKRTKQGRRPPIAPIKIRLKTQASVEGGGVKEGGQSLTSILAEIIKEKKTTKARVRLIFEVIRNVFVIPVHCTSFPITFFCGRRGGGYQVRKRNKMEKSCKIKYCYKIKQEKNFLI